MILVRSDGVELRPESQLVSAPPIVIACCVDSLLVLDLSIAAFFNNVNAVEDHS